MLNIRQYVRDCLLYSVIIRKGRQEIERWRDELNGYHTKMILLPRLEKEQPVTERKEER